MSAMCFGRRFTPSLALRQRWWREIDYGRRKPSAELLAAVQRDAATESSATKEEPHD